jgi:mRNA interferase MazF
MKVRRGDIVLLDFPFASGAGASRRPALVVQSDHNNVRIDNTIVAMVTRTTHRASREPTQILIDPMTPDGRATGLLHESAITCENLFTIRNDKIVQKIGAVPTSALSQIDECLKAALGIE